MRREMTRVFGVLAICVALASCAEDAPSGQPDAGSIGGAGAAAGSSGGAGVAGMALLAGAPGAGAAAAAGGGAGAPAAAGSGGMDAGMPDAAMPVAGGGGSQPTAASLTAKIVAKNIAPNGQEHVCVVVELSNTAPVWVNRMHATLAGGSHHLIADRRPASTPLIAEPQVCSPTMASDASRLMIAQQVQTEVKLPEGVAFKLDAKQRMFLQLHYFNASDQTRDITGSLELFIADERAGTPIEAKTLFTGQMAINIPARSASEVKAFHSPRAQTGVRRIFALTSHTHRLGVRATIERVASMTAPATTPLHESLNWSEPPLTMLDPPLAFTGADGLRLTCRYQNDTDQPVTFGVEAQDEMCFMWLYYYDARE